AEDIAGLQRNFAENDLVLGFRVALDDDILNMRARPLDDADDVLHFVAVARLLPIDVVEDVAVFEVQVDHPLVVALEDLLVDRLSDAAMNLLQKNVAGKNLVAFEREPAEDHGRAFAHRDHDIQHMLAGGGVDDNVAFDVNDSGVDVAVL